MKNKAQVILIVLWILFILTVLAVSVGHHVSLALRVSRYQRDKLKAHYLAHAGLNTALNHIISDNTPAYDSFQDAWADNEGAFKNILLSENPDEFAQVSYDTNNNGQLDTVFGAKDEERKININLAALPLLIALLEKKGIQPAQAIAQNILIWRGDIADENNIYGAAGYAPKGEKLMHLEELKLVAGIDSAAYGKIKDAATVYGEGLININTAPQEVINILARGIAKESSIAESFADTLAAKVIIARESTGYFKDKKEIDIELTGSEEQNLFNSLMEKIMVKSDVFLIEVSGNVGKIKREISCVYERKAKKLRYWHED